VRRLVGALALAALACSAATRVADPPQAPLTAGADAGESNDASVAARVADAETAWLVAHLADEPDPTHLGESDAVRRLAQRGAPGALAVAEVFRVGDGQRIPFARRVVERVAGRRCQHDRARTARVVAWLHRGGEPPALDPDAGVTWSGGDLRWSNAAVDRLRAWATEGASCDLSTPDAGATP
jgi:hypothetical protein